MHNLSKEYPKMMYHKGGRHVVVDTPEKETALGEGWRVEQWPDPKPEVPECSNCAKQAEAFDASWKQLMGDYSGLLVEHEALKVLYTSRIEGAVATSTEHVKLQESFKDLSLEHSQILIEQANLTKEHEALKASRAAADEQIAGLQRELDEATKASAKKPAKTA
jgi:hypothetical protein